MSADTIQASVGMHDNGAKNCYNLAKDIQTVVKLLNFIVETDGGTSSHPLSPSASPVQLSRAIQHFQQTQNDLGGTPRLSVDGHVDPGQSTLARLNQIARKISPITIDDLFFPPLREPIPGFDVVAPDGTIIELPLRYVRPNGTSITYVHTDANVTVRVEEQGGHKFYFVVIDNPTNQDPTGPLRPVPKAIAEGIAKAALKKAVSGTPKLLGFALEFGISKVVGGLVSAVVSVLDPSPLGRVIMFVAKREDKNILYTIINP